MKAKKEAFRTAMVSHDTATLHTMMRDAKPELERLRADRKTILDVFAKYRTTAPAPVATGISPAMIYPNPVRAGSAAARIQYHLKAAGTVRIEGRVRVVAFVVPPSDRSLSSRQKSERQTISLPARRLSVHRADAGFGHRAG